MLTFFEKHKNDKGPSIKDVSQNFRFLGYPPSPCLLKSTSEVSFLGIFCTPLPPPLGRRLLWMVPYLKGLYLLLAPLDFQTCRRPCSPLVHLMNATPLGITRSGKKLLKMPYHCLFNRICALLHFVLFLARVLWHAN